ncbi:hypothetical protein [Blastococcus sp. SYSU D00820]
MWFWIAGALVVWVLAALLLALALGRGIRMADERTPGTGVERPLTTADLPGAVVAARPARRRVPLPPVGVGLAATAVALEAVGYALRLSDVTGPTARLLSMDAPYSLPRLFVAALFAAAAVAAVAGAARFPGRRAWWLSVGLVAAAIATVKAGSTVHAEAMNRLSDATGAVGATVVSVLAAGAVLATLGFLSRAERRDRRRVLSTLGLYALASVGLSAVSAMVAGAGRLAAAATFVEESGEALAGVAVLIAVLVGVAPRLVLPASWVLNREEDAQVVEVASPIRRFPQP